MVRNGCWVVAFSVLALLAPVAHAAGDWSIGVSGGVGIPTGDFGSDDPISGVQAQSGPTIGLDISYHLSNLLAFGVDGGWTSNKHKSEGETEDLGGGLTFTSVKDRFISYHVGAHGKVMIPMPESRIRPYGVVGLGVYNLKDDYEWVYDDGTDTFVFTDEIDSASQPGSRLGGRIGAGALFKVTEQLGVGLEADYNLITLDKDTFGLSSLQYATFRALVSYTIKTHF